MIHSSIKYWWFYATEEGHKTTLKNGPGNTNTSGSSNSDPNNKAAKKGTLSRSGSGSNLSDTDLQAYEGITYVLACLLGILLLFIIQIC